MHDDSWHNHCLMTGTFVPVSCCGLHAQAFISDFISMAAGIDWGYPVLVLALTDFSTGVAGFLVPVSSAEWLNFCFFYKFFVGLEASQNKNNWNLLWFSVVTLRRVFARGHYGRWHGRFPVRFLRETVNVLISWTQYTSVYQLVDHLCTQ